MDETVVPMDSLGEAFDRLANDNRVGSYVKAGARQALLRLGPYNACHAPLLASLSWLGWSLMLYPWCWS